MDQGILDIAAGYAAALCVLMGVMDQVRDSAAANHFHHRCERQLLIWLIPHDPATKCS
jgi:hypothetical protein